MKIGTTVRLKSGGPLMTAVEVSDDRVWCMWFADEKFDVAEASFHVLSLIEIDDTSYDEMIKVYGIAKHFYEVDPEHEKINLLDWLKINLVKKQ